MEDKHIGKRRGFEEMRERDGRVRAAGSIGYATAYGVLEQQAAMRDERDLIRTLQGKHPPNWQVERRVRADIWVTADRAMQGATMAEAQDLVKGLPGYRVVRVWGTRRRGH
jgi:hypothetical protein